MHVETIIVGEFQVNCFVVWAAAKESGDRAGETADRPVGAPPRLRGRSHYGVAKARGAIVIDPGSEAANILAVIEKNKLTVAVYLLTHGHIDHISALVDMYEAIPAQIGLHGADLEWAFDKSNQMLPFYGAPRCPSEIARLLQDGQEWTDAGLTYKVISTPGHTPGSVCFFFPEQNVLFSGDTLFAGSVGCTDLPGGNPSVLNASLERIAQMPDNTIVYPGHGPATEIACEKKNNFFLQPSGL